jgi:hypothetical protein
MDLEHIKKIKNLRFKSYLHRRAAISKLFQPLGDPLFCGTLYLGNGYSRGSNFLRGSHPSPKGNTLRKLLINAGYDVVMVNEFNTSQVCEVVLLMLTFRSVQDVISVRG